MLELNDEFYYDFVLGNLNVPLILVACVGFVGKQVYAYGVLLCFL